MSTDKNNIDQLFSDAAHSQKAPQYNAAYWAEMNALLNAKDAKKRAFILWAFAGSALFAVLFLSLFIVNMDFNQAEKRYTQTALHNTVITEHSDVTIKESTNDQKTSTQNEVYNSKINQTDNSSLNTQSTITSLESNNEKSVVQNSNDLQTKTASGEKYSKDKLSLTYAHTMGNGTDKIYESKSAKLNNDRVNSNHDLVEENTLNDEYFDNEEVQTLPFDKTNSIHQNDPGDLFNSALKYKSNRSLTVYSKLSGGLMENYKTSRPYESGLLDLSLNLEMNFDGVLLRTGIGTQLTSNADLIVSQRAKVYGFGVTNHQNDLSYQNLFDIYIPIELGYKINATSFGIGAQANYLLTTGMVLNNYENHKLVNRETYNGSTEGLHTFSTQGYVWMEHQFTSRFSLGLKVGTNISGRIKDSDYFNQSSTTNPIYGQLSLRFNIIQ
ncbi:MAG TPA: hypothetical protein VFD77_02760 [Brumimicrobium sp.]|nr:hypothetical protein [Brumimicrobium sp.]